MVSSRPLSPLINEFSSNTALEHLMARYPNAWCLIAPGISDSSIGIFSFTSEESHLQMWESSAMSSHGKHAVAAVHD
jgi:hypothetical protein